MTRPGLVAIDVDGTLANQRGDITARTIAAVGAVRSAGVPLVLATGRPWLVVERTATTIGGADWVVCSNGAMNVRLADEAITRDVYLADGLPAQLVPRLRAAIPGIRFALELAKGVKSEPGLQRRLPPGVPLGRTVDDVLALLPDRGPVRKLMVFHDDFDDDIAGLAAAVSAVAGPELDVEHSGMPFAEVGLPGVNKAVALAEVCDELGILQAEVLAFGDDVNDRHLLRWAGVGVAMANAKEAAKAAADEMTLSNAEDGVAVYLERIFHR